MQATGYPIVSRRRTDESGRVTFTVTDLVPNVDTGEYGEDINYYRTNPDGQGLWILTRRGDWRQILGTCQFDGNTRRHVTAWATENRTWTI